MGLLRMLASEGAKADSIMAEACWLRSRVSSAEEDSEVLCMARAFADN